MIRLNKRKVYSAFTALILSSVPAISSAEVITTTNNSTTQYTKTDPLPPNQLWNEMKDVPGFIEALDELGITYNNLTNEKYAEQYNALDVNDVLFWLARTLNIYRSSDQGIYNIPVTEIHDNGRNRTAGKGRNSYFPTHVWGKKGETITIEMKDIPENVSCSAAIDPNYVALTKPTDTVEMVANQLNTYTMEQDALLVLGCLDQTTTMEGADKMVSFTIRSGGTYHPLFVFGLDNAADWETQTATTPSGYTFMFDGHSRFVITTPKAQNADGTTILKVLRESLLRVMHYDKINGLDGSSWLHQPSRGLITATYNDCCWAQDGQGMTGIDTSIPSTSGWGEWHEYGHQWQTGWSWGGLTEITVNLYSLAACYTTLGDVDIKQCHSNSGLTGFTWDQQAVGSLLNSGQTWNFNTENQFRRATFFGELLTSWPQLYPQLGKAYREINQSNPKAVSSSQQKIDWFALNTSQIAGVNLNTYFQQWGIPVSADMIAQINALNLPQPKKTLHTYTAELTEYQPVLLKMEEPEQAINIGFIANSPDIGPTSLTWKENGETPVYVPVLDNRGRRFAIKLRGEASHGECGNDSLNSAVSCSSGKNTFLHLAYVEEDNPLLPAGNYQGVLHLIANDWHKSDWSANVNVTISIFKK